MHYLFKIEFYYKTVNPNELVSTLHVKKQFELFKNIVKMLNKFIISI